MRYFAVPIVEVNTGDIIIRRAKYEYPIIARKKDGTVCIVETKDQSQIDILTADGTVAEIQEQNLPTIGVMRRYE